MSSQKALDQLRSIYPLSEEAFDRLNLYVARLEEWQKKTNLIAPSTLDEIWQRHVADSLQCLAIKPDVRRWLDIGSGGGFPGLVIAAIMADYDDSTLVMVESNNKKTAFLRQVNRQMGATAKVVTSRIEDVEIDDFVPEIVTARALTALPGLLELSDKWLSQGAIGLFHKGREYESELQDCHGLWRFDLINHESKISADSVILEISKLEKISG
ncbi:MAG: 16S rRNA (guanine(527)-N(7))-methyltransferase RsmG [Rhizobiaceae bacterium]|nr:16S rRNA (guanine(527)-N(7))-methyltransferase RsmG [Rhizobiaceae bacterium]